MPFTLPYYCFRKVKERHLTTYIKKQSDIYWYLAGTWESEETTIISTTFVSIPA